MTDASVKLLSLFNRPFQPAFVPKNDVSLALASPSLVSNKITILHAVFAIFLFLIKKPEEYNKIKPDVSTRFGELSTSAVAGVEAVSQPQNENKLEELVSELPKDEFFSFFIPKHKKISAKLVALFLGERGGVFNFIGDFPKGVFIF